MTAQELVKDAIKKAFNTLKKKSAIYSNGKEIPASANLNNYTTVGVYYSPSAARSETLSNTPVTNAGYKLIVAQTGYTGTSYVVQIAILGAASYQCIYMRNRTASAWNDWRCLTQGDMRSAFIYASTYAELYSLCTSMQTSRSSTFSLTATAANAISGNAIGATYKGIVNKVNDTTYDFIGASGAGGSIWTIRATLGTASATVSNIQRMVVPSTSSPLIKNVTYTHEYSVAANTTLNVTANELGISTPSGYSPIAMYYVATGSADVVPRNINAGVTGTSVSLALRNVSSATKTGTCYLGITYMRSEAVSG